MLCFNNKDSDEGLINTTNISMNEMSLTENRSLGKNFIKKNLNLNEI